MRFCACLAILAISITLPVHAQVFGAPLPAVQSEQPDSKRYTLSGTVVNSVTNEPIRRALVTLFSQQQIPVMTDSDGRFEFTDLPRSSVTIAAQKPGYFSEQELSSGRHRPRQIPVGPDTQSIVIKLVPEAIISGRIIDPDGLPIPNLMIRAVTQRVLDGRKQWTQGTTDRTGADGAYRIINLMPGSYFVVAGPGHAQAFVAGADDTSDLGYPAVVYPGSSPMRINAGQHVDANFTIKPEPFYSVTGSVSGTTPGNRYFVQLIPQVPGARMAAGGSPVDAESGTFSLPRVARGDYLLQARGMVQVADGRRIGSQMFGSVPISVRSNLMGVTVALEPGLTIPVNVRVERTRDQSGPAPPQNFPRAQVRLMPDEEDRPPAFSSPDDPKDPGSQLVVRNVVPGHYRVELQSTFGDMYVASARYGMTDLLNGDLTIAPNATQSAIDIVLRDDGGRIEVKLQGEVAKSGATILVVPDVGVPRVQEASANPNAEIFLELGGLRPGTYTVLAFEDIGNLEYTNRAALDPYLSRGSKVSLTPNQQATVTPQLLKAVGE